MSTSTSTATATAFTSLTLHPSDFARLMSERHYLFLSQSLNDLQHQIDRHHAERNFIYDRLLEAGLVEPRVEPHTRSPMTDSIATNGRGHSVVTNRQAELIDTNGRAESMITNGRQKTRRYRYHPYTEHRSRSSFRRIPSPLSNTEIQHRRQSLNPIIDADSELGTKENPIHVRDDDVVRCEGCGEDGHIIWDCTKEYIFDDEWQCTTPPTNATHSNPSHSLIQDFKQESGKSTTLKNF
jgi:hypothetical protein